MKDYKKEYKEFKLIKEVEENRFNIIYVIPDKPYDGFWGKNGYNSFDFVLENTEKDIKGWFHWEGDVIDFQNINNMTLDSEEENNYIRLFAQTYDELFKLEGVMVSRIVISMEEQ